MAVQVLIPTPLRRFTNNQESISASAGTVASLITEMESLFPGISKSLTDDKGELRRFVNVYVNEEDIRFLDRENTVLNDGDAVSIVPAIAGG